MVAKKKAAEGKSGTVKVKWVVSFISCTDDMRQTIRGLGLRRMHQVVEREDTPAVRGMIHKVRHFVELGKKGKGEKNSQEPKEAQEDQQPPQAGEQSSTARTHARELIE